MTEMIETGLAVFEHLYAEVRAVRERKLSEENFLRAYYLEVKGNLELLDLLKDGALKGKNAGEPGFASFIGRLQTQLAAAILFDERGSGHPGSTYSRLRRECPVIIPDIAFTVVKIGILKRLAEFTADEKKLLHGVNLETRLDNIEKRLVSIVKGLVKTAPIMEFSSANETE
jgi:hypothetical protein